MSSITSSQAFLLSRDRELGDYSHGQTISYYDESGILVKTEFKNVLLWSNSGKEFDREAWKTFQPRIEKTVSKCEKNNEQTSSATDTGNITAKKAEEPKRKKAKVQLVQRRNPPRQAKQPKQSKQSRKPKIAK